MASGKKLGGGKPTVKSSKGMVCSPMKTPIGRKVGAR
jgi:hypothetical protein